MEMKQIPDYPNYAVTREGRVWSYISNKFIKKLDMYNCNEVNVIRQGVFYPL